MHLTSRTGKVVRGRRVRLRRTALDFRPADWHRVRAADAAEPTPNRVAPAEQEEQTDLYSVQGSLGGSQIGFVFVIQVNGSRIILTITFPSSSIDGEDDGGDDFDDDSTASGDDRLIPGNRRGRYDV